MNKRFYFLFILLNLFIWGDNNAVLSKESEINILQLKKQAKLGDAKAQNTLGDYYNSPNDVFNSKGCFPYSRRQTIKYYTKAAHQNYTKAQKNLGMLYTKIPCPDYDKGIFWLKKVASKGDIEAQLRLADVYSRGSTEKEFQKAVYWYKKAAQTKNTMAIRLLGMLYSDPRYGHIDYEKAIFWYKKGMVLGDAYSSRGLCDLYFISQYTSEEEIARYKEDGLSKDNKKSDQYCRIAADQGDAESQFLVGARYMTGRRVPKDEKKAMEYFKKSCLQKDDMGCKAYHGKMNFNDVTY